MATKILATKFPRLNDEKEREGRTVKEIVEDAGGKVLEETVKHGDREVPVISFEFETEPAALFFGFRWS